MRTIKLIIFAAVLTCVFPAWGKTIPNEKLSGDVRASVERYVTARDSLEKVLRQHEARFEAGDTSASLRELMDKKLDKIAELDAVIAYYTLDKEGSTPEEICIVARKLINTLRFSLAAKLMESTKASGVPFAMNYIGVWKHTDGDDAEAMKWFRKAADAGYAPAIHNVALMIFLRPDLFSGKEYADLQERMGEAYLKHPDVECDNPTLGYIPPFSIAEYVVDQNWLRSYFDMLDKSYTNMAHNLLLLYYENPDVFANPGAVVRTRYEGFFERHGLNSNPDEFPDAGSQGEVKSEEWRWMNADEAIMNGLYLKLVMGKFN